MKYKYCVHKNNPPKQTHLGRPVNPDTWISGPDPLAHDKYYAWLKHRSQARYRGEQYELSWDDWNSLWSNEDFAKRGRKNTDLCLARINQTESWNYANCHVVTRKDHLKRNGEFRKSNGE